MFQFDFITAINQWLTFYIIFPSIFGLGIYLSIRLRWIQLTQIPQGFRNLLSKCESSEGSISHYEAVSAVLAGNLGTGNISGMAVALATGGPGALVWMWLMAFFGAIIQYVSCFLGVKYRQKNETGELVGGPMYYLNKGMGSPRLAKTFALMVILGAFTAGNLVQVNSVSLPLQRLNIDPLLFGSLVAILVGVVLLGGLQRFARLASSIVPLMAVLYLGTALTILALHIDAVIPAFGTMLSAAFSSESLAGGAIGFGMMKAISAGFSRGIFATDAGTGMAPILQSSARTQDPHAAGIVALVAPLIVMVVCTVTGLVLIVTGAWNTPGMQSTNLCLYAFETGLGSQIGAYIVMVSLMLFAYTTILAWACCAERAVEYLWGSASISIFRYIFIALVPIGALMHVTVVWVLADIAMSGMVITNLIGIAALSAAAIRSPPHHVKRSF